MLIHTYNYLNQPFLTQRVRRSLLSRLLSNLDILLLQSYKQPARLVSILTFIAILDFC